MRVPEPLPPEPVESAQIPEESIELNPEDENFHFRVQDVKVPRHEEEEVVANAPAAFPPHPFDEAIFQESNVMGPRYLPSPESIFTIPNANLEMSIDRLLGGRENWEQYNTQEFKAVIRQCVQKFVKGMQTSILNICLLWKQVLARKAKSNIGSIEILNPDNPEYTRTLALTNRMVRIPSGSDFLDIWVSSHNGNLQDKFISQEIWDLIVRQIQI